MKDKKKKRQIAKISVFITSIFVILFSVTYAFITQVISGTKQVVVTAGVLDLVLEEENSITIENALPMYDEVGMIQEPFTFRLVNNGSNPVNYNLKLVDVTPQTVERKCSELGEITLDSPAGCRDTIYPDELRQEALMLCQDWYPDVTTEEECIEANEYDGFYYDSFEEFIDEGIMYNEFEDTRTLVDTYPDNVVEISVWELPDWPIRYGLTKNGENTIGSIEDMEYTWKIDDLELRERALEMCKNWYPEVTDEESCLEALKADGAPFETFDDFIGYEFQPNGNRRFTLDAGKIGANETIDYDLRLWIDEYVEYIEDIEGLTFSFKIDVEVSQEIIPAENQSCFTYNISDYIVNDYQACSNYLIENGISSSEEMAIHECKSITEGYYESFRTNYPDKFQKMLSLEIIKAEHGATITGYTCTDDYVDIPDILTVEKNELLQLSTEKIAVPVVAIGDEAFGSQPGPMNNTKTDIKPSLMSATNVSSLYSVIIPNTVKHIGSYAFAQLNLQKVTIPTNLQVICSAAFSDNQLSTINILDSIVYIGSGAFGNNQLTSITIPTSITKIYGGTFQNNQLISISLPNNITAIDNYAFGNNQLTSIEIPSSVKYLSGFNNNKIKNITIPESVTIIGESAFANNQLTDIEIPDKITKIGSSAFMNNYLKELYIPESVTEIKYMAFSNNELETVSLPNTITILEQAIFRKNKLKNFTIPESVIKISPEVLSYNELSTIEIPKNVETIYYDALLNNPQLTAVINKSGRAFDWKYIIFGEKATSFVTGSVSYENQTVNITSE